MNVKIKKLNTKSHVRIVALNGFEDNTWSFSTVYTLMGVDKSWLDDNHGSASAERSRTHINNLDRFFELRNDHQIGKLLG